LIDEEVMIDEIHQELRTSIGKAHDALKRDLAKVRTGRANSAMVDSVRVMYYGSSTPLNQMASINIPEPRMITIKPFDKTALKAVEKALIEADLGFNPQPDGDIIRVPVPPLTEERRKDMVKLAKKYGEDCKVTIRGARREALETLSMMQSDGDASEDEVERGKKKVEEIVSDGTKSVDQFVSSKEKDVAEI
jgi:ribosome recycling factor